MIIIKITQVEMHPKPGERSCLKVLLIDQDFALNYIRRQPNYNDLNSKSQTVGV